MKQNWHSGPHWLLPVSVSYRIAVGKDTRVGRAGPGFQSCLPASSPGTLRALAGSTAFSPGAHDFTVELPLPSPRTVMLLASFRGPRQEVNGAPGAQWGLRKCPAENVTAERALTDHSVQSLPLAIGCPRPGEGSDFPWCSVGEGGRVGENQLPDAPTRSFSLPRRASL